MALAAGLALAGCAPPMLGSPRGPQAGPLDAEALAADFTALAFRAEALEGGIAEPGGSPARLTRWAPPSGAALGYAFEGGAPEDRAEARRLLARLSGLTGLSFSEGEGEAALRIRFLDPERRRRDAASAQDFRALRRLWAEEEGVFCLALGETDETGALIRAEVLLKAEADPERRRSCLAEELGQAMGLFNDAATRGPSVFDDDDRHALWTAQDEALLRLLYDPRLTPGMGAQEAAPILREIAKEAARRAAGGGRP